MNPPPLSSPSATSSSRGCFLYSGIVLIMFLLVFQTACIITYVMPKKFESTAVVQVRQSTHQKGSSTSQQLATEFEVIRAHLTLKLVVQRLGLTTQWNMTEEDAISVLKGIVDAQNIHGTDLIQIKVRHTDPEQARDIAKEVYEAYKKRREEKARELSEQSLKELKRTIQEQSEIVEEKRRLRDHAVSASIKPDRPMSDFSGDDSIPASVKKLQIEFETQHSVLENMRQKLVTEQLDAKIISLVDLHEEPLVAQFPSSPNVNLNLIMGAGLGLLLGLLMALFVRLVFGRKISG